MEKYKICTNLGWKEVDGEPFNYPGYDLGLFLHKDGYDYIISEPRTGWCIVCADHRCTSPEAARAYFTKIIAKYPSEELKRIIDRCLPECKTDLISITLQIPGSTYEILSRRAKGDIPGYLTKRIVYDTTRKH